VVLPSGFEGRGGDGDTTLQSEKGKPRRRGSMEARTGVAYDVGD